MADRAAWVAGRISPVLGERKSGKTKVAIIGYSVPEQMTGEKGQEESGRTRSLSPGNRN